MSLRSEIVRIINELLSGSKKISELPSGTTPDGTELIEGVQGGENVKFTISQISIGGSGVQTIVAGTNITVDDTDPQNPIVSSSGGGGGITELTGDVTASGSGSVVAVIANGAIIDSYVNPLAAIAGTKIANAPSGNIAATTVQDAINELDTEKQATLVSATNIKTINGNTLLGSGDLVVSGGSGWAITGATTLTGPVDIVGDATNIIKYSFDALGQTATDGAGLLLENSTVATAGTQQNSPSITLQAVGNNSAGGNETIRVRSYIAPRNSGNAVSLGDHILEISLAGGTYKTLVKTDLLSGKMTVDGNLGSDEPPFIEYARHLSGVEISRGAMGHLGSTEMNMSVNMDYTTGSHRYYDTTKNAIWTFLSNVTNSMGIQWTKSGHPNDDTMWTTYGKVIWEVSVIPHSSTGEAVTGGCGMKLQQLTFIDDNYTSPNGLIKLSGTKMSFTGMDQLVTPRMQIGTEAIVSTEVLTLQSTGNTTWVQMENDDNNSNFNQFQVDKNKAGSYNIGAGTKIFELNANTLGRFGFRANAANTLTGSFSLPDAYIRLTTSAGTETDRLVMTHDGLNGFLTSTPNSTLHANGSFSTAYVAKTALYTLTASDHTVEVTSGTHTQTLPTAVGITGREYVITNSGSGVVTVGTTSSQTFVNVTATPTTLTLNQFQGVIVKSNGANWIKIAGF